MTALRTILAPRGACGSRRDKPAGDPPAKIAALALAAALLAACGPHGSAAAATDALTLERKIPLGEVSGRLDHLAVDLAHHRLFLAELGNNSVAVIDVAAGSLLHRIGRLSEPQGVGYVGSTDTIYAANAGDGALHRYRGSDFSPLDMLSLGEDADNIRVARDGGKLFVGYGKGALAIVDAASGSRTGEIRLAGHPEGFQLDPSGARIYVNVPEARQIAVLDHAAMKQVDKWSLSEAGDNFPMALEASGRRLFVGYRHPALLAVFDTGSGKPIARIPICGDTDDVFVDEMRRRVYVSCGEGAIDVLEQQGEGWRELGRIPTVSGARTSLWVPELDRLFLAVRARSGEPAAVWVYRP